ncbi:MAG: hypothetical protein AUG51_00310 [Acidobacteria bacterium 13_1_20CM_3_53_8]|nr:MAG: hypothetical protein AUG51_00310 [Acidobacteria bacterium 13_1_20CM_3_53_8]
MTSERWQRVKYLFESALEREPVERAAFLNEACNGDESLREEVESLLAAYNVDDSFMEMPAVAALAHEIIGDELAELKSGQLFTSYKILDQLGVGGMGEVYLAEDMKLERKVALKLLPAYLSKNANRLRRFEQEARAASALNHPNVCVVHEVGEAEGGRHYIAMEYVEGETLRASLAGARPGINETLHISIQIASALAVAHKAGIIHRDIKPENVMLREDGLVKVLDFGLVKLAEKRLIAADAEATTLAQVKTAPGLIMGTVNYMSPEQARGVEVDERTDIFSLGAVLYEMIAGRSPFDGETTSDVISLLLQKEPQPLARLAPDVPAELARIVMKALRKDREERYQVVKDMLLDLKSLKEELEFKSKLEQTVEPEFQSDAARGSEPKKSAPIKEAASRTELIEPARTTASIERASFVKAHKRWVVSSLVALTLVGLVFGLYKFITRRNAENAKQTHADQMGVMKTTQLTTWSGLDLSPTFSPDGNFIAYSSDHQGSYKIYVKPLTPGGREIQLTSDGEQNFEPAWSPDGQRIAYYSRGRGGIWVIPALGGTARQLTEFGTRPAWSHDSSLIAFQSVSGSADLSATSGGVGGGVPGAIWVVPAQGGQATQITQPGNPIGNHVSPSWSPDGSRILFANFGAIWSTSARGGESKRLTQVTGYIYSSIYSPDGESIYYSASTQDFNFGLWRLRISPGGEAVGEPVEIASMGTTSAKYLAVSSDGKRLAYSAASTASNIWSIPISERTGEATGSPVPLTSGTNLRNGAPAFSPDGRKIALSSYRTGTDTYISVIDADGKNPTPVIISSAHSVYPSWFPDGEQIMASSLPQEGRTTVWVTSLKSGRDRLLLDPGQHISFPRLSPDGKMIAFNSMTKGVVNVWVIPVEGGKPRQLTFDQELMGFPDWSPDGQWLTFQMKRGEDSYLMIMPSGGGTPTQLTFDRGNSWPHDFSPDGDRIVFAGERDGIWNIYWISRTTKQQKQLTNYTKLSSFVRYPSWSPLGNQIAYEYAETTGNIWMLELR